jgi:hypothetical protein
MMEGKCLQHTQKDDFLATNRGFLGISLVEKCFFTPLCNFFSVNPKVAQCGHAVPVKKSAL